MYSSTYVCSYCSLLLLLATSRRSITPCPTLGLVDLLRFNFNIRFYISTSLWVPGSSVSDGSYRRCCWYRFCCPYNRSMYLLLLELTQPRTAKKILCYYIKVYNDTVCFLLTSNPYQHSRWVKDASLLAPQFL